MKIGILYDGGSPDWEQKDVAAVLANVNEIQGALRAAGHETALIPVHLGDVAWLRRVQRHELIFNLCEGVNGYAKYEDFAVAAPPGHQDPQGAATPDHRACLQHRGGRH